MSDGVQRKRDSAASPRTQRIALAHGIELAADCFGASDAPCVLMFHGGGQTRHSWANAGRQLGAEGWHVQCFDLRGHGESSWPADADYSLSAFADDVRQLARRCDSPPVLVGASLGGQAVLTAVAESDEPLARAIVLVDIATQMEVAGFERIVGFLRAHKAGFATLEEAADAIAAYRNKPRSRDLAGLRKNLRTGPQGRLYWHWDPRFAEGDEGHTTSQQRLEDAARALRLPTLLVRGAQSDLLSVAGARHFLELVPHARYVDVRDASHMVVGDRNDAFTEAVREFLASSRDAGASAHGEAAVDR